MDPHTTQNLRRSTAVLPEDGNVRVSLAPRLTLHEPAVLWETEAAGARVLSASPAPGACVIDAAEVTALDTAGALTISAMAQTVRAAGVEVRYERLTPDHAALLELVDAHRPVAAEAAPPPGNAVEQLDTSLRSAGTNAFGFLSFLGHVFLTTVGALLRPSRIRGRLVLRNLQTAGADAVPIIGLLSFLIGVVIAYQGADQLHRYGADIFIVDLVGLSLLRELAPLMTAIIVAGRTGSAYTAQIGTMRVTEEVDALQVIGLSPVDVLVRPKVFALLIALPLLTAFADVVSIFGAVLMTASMTAIGPQFFLEQFPRVVPVESYLVGIGKAPVFALVIASVGCWQGFQASDSAESVGARTTLSVVQSVFLIIVLDALFSIVFSIVGI